MQATDELIRTVVQEVLSQLGRAPVGGNGRAADGRFGVFRSVDDAVAAAEEAFRAFRAKSLEDRRRAVACIRRITSEQAEELGRMELEETKIGRLDHKIEKLTILDRVPGVEFLRSEAVSGDHGLTVTEYAPFGVIGAITPVTHSLPTLAGNAINMLAAGNTVVVNPHPGGARVACEGVRRFNQAIYREIGIDALITIIEEPTLESAQAIFRHRGVRLLCVTGGPAVGRAALESRKRAIVAGPGNPPVVVDETACAERAAKAIIQGGAYDNNLLCIGEKEVFAVDSIFDRLMDAMSRHGGYRLSRDQIEALASIAFKPADKPPPRKGGVPGHGQWLVNKDLIGKDAAVLADRIGLRVPPGTELLYGETEAEHPFVSEEQMMPFVPLVRCPNVDAAIALAKDAEHGFGHTSIIHSRNVSNMTRMGRELDTTLFIKNGPCMAGLGLGGEGYLSYSIATPTGEGVTTPLTFTRQRRCAMVDELRIV